MSTDAAHPDGVVFDCDGTLVDTEPLSDLALEEVLDGLGHPLTPSLRSALLGRPWAHNWAVLQEQLGLTDETWFRDAYRTAFRRRFETDAVLFDDAVRVARSLADRGVPLAVATSSSRRHLEAVLDLGLRDVFSVTVAAEDTDEHKPGPAPYLHACRGLGVEARSAVAIEDSPVGIASARSAGLTVVAVHRGQADAGSLSAAHRVVRSLDVSDIRLG